MTPEAAKLPMAELNSESLTTPKKPHRGFVERVRDRRDWMSHEAVRPLA